MKDNAYRHTFGVLTVIPPDGAGQRPAVPVVRVRVLLKVKGGVSSGRDARAPVLTGLI
jgi:hypothetical protein